jgi:hypothetical protein
MLPGARRRRIPLHFMGDHPEAYRPMRQATNRRCISQREDVVGLMVLRPTP